MKRILSTLTLLLCFAFTAVNAQDNYDATTMGEKVYLETANWGQNSPFNKQIFTSYGGSTNAKAGCVPTAYAIVMRYHGFPTEGTAKTLYNCQAPTYVEITDRVYDFSKMPLTNGSNWTEEQQTETSKFFSHVLHACFPSSIGTGATTVNEGSDSKVLNDYFNYQLINASYQANFTMEQWIEKIKESIDNGCPIPYASDNSGTGDTRHMFILDGYTANNYFHFNFGWNGSGNGWFKLDAITPSQGDNYSWIDGAEHYALFNLAPNKTMRTVTASVSPAGAGTVTVNGNTNSAEVMEGTRATLVATANSGYTFSHWSNGGAQVSTEKTYKASVAAEGNEYVANFLTVGNTTVNVSVTYNSSYGTVTYNSNAVNGTGITPYQNSEVTLVATPLDGYVFNGWTVTKGANSTNYFGDELTFVATEDMSVEARFSLAVADYTISTSNITPSNYRPGSSSYCSTWTTADGIVLSATKNSEKAYALSVSNARLYAKATTESSSDNLSNDITFTLTAPNGYIILDYSIDCYSNSGSYSVNVTPEGGSTTNVASDFNGTISANVNAASARFNLSSNDTGQPAINFRSFTVTLQKEGTEGGSTPEPEQPSTPTTYAITTTANPAEGGTAKFSVGTGSQQTQGDVNDGESITLYAVASTGYNFVNWTLNENVVGTDATCNVAVSQAANYVANFEAVQQGGSSSDDLAGKWFRLKENNNNRYMNVKNHTAHTQKVSAGGVNVAAKDENSNAQKFFFEKSGDGYMLKDGDGYYINCLEWSVDASSTTSGSVLLFEETATESIYYIKWDNTYKGGVKYFKVGADSNGTGDHPYCDADNKTVTWTLEEVIPSNEKTLNVTFNNATYTKTDGTELTSGWGYQVVTQTTPAVTIKVAETINNFGYTTGVITGVKTPYLYKNTNFILSISEQYKITGYNITVRGQDNSYSGDFACSVGGNETSKATLSGTTTQTLSATGLDTNIINISVGGTSGNGIFITALEITYVENEFEPLPFKAEIENWRNDNPNTHLGTITIGGTAMKLTPAHQTASELTMPVVEGTALAFTRKYRGFEFLGFYIGATELGQNPTLTADNVAAINETTPLVAKFTATDDVTLFYDDDQYSYRIPAIAKTGNGMLVAVTDYRHNLDDIGRDNHGTGTKRIDLVMRTSTDNGATWSETKTIAAGDNSKEGSYLRAFGDAAIAAVGQNIVVMAAAGDVVYTAGTTSSPNKMARIYSSDNGATWAIEEMTTKMYSQSTSLIPSGGSAFFGSGKLAVDPNFNGTGNARIYGALLVRIGTDGYNNFGVFSDDLGATWKILGGDNTNPVAKGDEPKVEILPNGQILLSARRGGGRVFNVFTYGDDKANGAGTWSVDAQNAVNGCDNGGSNATNGEIICLDAKRPNGKPTKILLQSQPKGGSGQYDRKDVTIWYKEVSADETYTAATIASGWTMGKQVSTVQSSYSAMALQANGEIALFFEEAPCYGDDYTKGYSMVYVPLTIEEITGENFLNPNAVVETVTVDVTLTDEQGNTYTHQFDYLPGDAAAIDAALMTAYPFITELGEGNLQGSDTYYTYTNTVILPFKVSNANTTVWHNIYWPANGTSAGEFYPIYMMANADNATTVAKITEKVHYGNSQYNTYNYADKLGWAVYNVNNSFTFKFKNKLTGKFMAVNGVVSSGNASNVIYTDEDNATAFTLTKNTGTTYKGDFAITSVYNSTTGYVCNTSAGYADATNYTDNGHHGAWVKIVESPDYWTIYEQLLADINNFGDGEGKYTENDAISSININDLASLPLNSLNTKAEEVQTVKESYREVVLTVNDDETATVPGSVSITVNGSDAETVNNKFVPANATVSILATANPGYRFVNWTRPAAQASAAARAAEARNSNVVSDQNPYTVTVSEALSLEANFEQIVVNVTLTDAQSNTYNVQVSGFTTEIKKGAVADKLREAYPYITLGTTDANGNVIDNGVLNINGTAYTYTNNVELPFKVSNTTDIWHNIYWPANTRNNDWPVYLSASSADDTYVPKVTGSYAYGDHPKYNIKAGNDKISWAIYNVNNGFEFIFKNKVTDKYIQVTSVANGGAQNVQYVENIKDATAFTIFKKPAGNDYYTPAQYALTAKVGETTGYLCSTSATGYHYATHYFSDSNNGYGHQGAWFEFVKAPEYFNAIMEIGTILGYKFGAGDGKCVIAGTAIEEIDNAMQKSDSITYNNLKDYAAKIDNAMSNDTEWHNVVLNVAPENSGTAIIQLPNDDPALTSKRVPTNYALPIVATPAEGYHFVNWTNGTDDVEGAGSTYTFDVTAATTLTANFAKNSYTISVLAGEGGSAMIGTETSATVEHGGSVTLTADANDGYEFVNWTKGSDVVSTEPSYTFTATADGEYVANFQLAGTPVTYYDINVNSNIDGTGIAAFIETGTSTDVTSGRYEAGSTVTLVAVPDNADVGSTGYLFTGWYIDEEFISSDETYTIEELNSSVTYTARFEEGWRVTYSCNYIMGYVNAFNADGTESIGGTNNVLVKKGTTIQVKATPNNNQYQFTNWTDGIGGTAVSTDNPYVVEVNNDMQLYANFEPRHYVLTVSANDDSFGTVTAESGTFGPASEVKVGIGMTATITATPTNGYKFVNWTKGNDVVSTYATYTVPAIDNVEDMVDAVEYVANFVEATEPGTYYRIGYDGFAAAAAAPAARVAATRAAGDTYTYTVTPEKGGITNTTKVSEWNSTETNPVILSMTATCGGTPIATIQRNANTSFKLYGYNSVNQTEIKYTISVPEGYIITNYQFTCMQKAASVVTIKYAGNEENYGDTGWHTISVSPNANTAEFELSTTSSSNNWFVVKEFTVTIQEAGGGETPETPEIPENIYYIQSKASGVSGKANALLMTKDRDASSIFYYAGNKLLSYDKGTYIKEDGGTRGLQAVGTSGTVTITTSGETATIAAPSYMHAVDGTTRYVDHCSGNPDNHAANHNFILEEVDSLPVTISSVGYASWYAPVAVQLPANVNAWYLTEDGVEDGYVSMEEIGVGGVVPAFTGVILEGPEGTHNLAITTADSGIAGNLLTGTVAATYITDDAYVLSKPSDNELGLYLVKFNQQGNNAWKNNSHKAYLPRRAVSPAMQLSAGFRFRFSGGVTTPIDEMEYENSEVKGIYDLTGRKLEGISGTGIYIINGKKVLIK